MMKKMLTGKMCRQFDPPPRIFVIFGLAALCILFLSIAGCKTTTPTHRVEGKLHPTDDVAFNVQQVRLRMRGLVVPLCGAIVEGADRIKAGTTDRDIQRGALLFKIEAVPAMRESLFQPDPFIAIFDAWVLARQMSDYYEKGKGKEALGDSATVAVATCQYLEFRIEDVAASLSRSGDVSGVADFAGKWAAEHPIEYSISGRESTMALITERDIQETFGAMELMGSFAVTLDDLIRRLDIYSAQLLDQSRWQAELFALDLGKDLQIEKAIPLAENAVQSAAEAMEAASRLIPSMERALAALESAPEMITKERIAAIESLHQELTHTLRFMQQERIAALTHITKERLAVLTDLHETIASERQALSDEMEEISRGVVDHAFLRAAQLTAVVLILLFIGILVLLILANRIFSRGPKDSLGSTTAP